MVGLVSDEWMHWHCDVRHEGNGTDEDDHVQDDEQKLESQIAF